MFPNLRELFKVLAKQPVIDERLVLLIRQIRLDHRVEELRVLLKQEEREFVTGVFAVERLLLFRLQIGPVGEEAELDKILIVRQRHQQAVYLGQRVESLDAAGGNVRHSERFIFVENRDAFLLGVVLCGIEAASETQVLKLGFLLGEPDPSHHRSRRIDGDHAQDCERPQCLARDLHDPLLVGHCVSDDQRAFREEVVIGESGIIRRRRHVTAHWHRSSRCHRRRLFAGEPIELRTLLRLLDTGAGVANRPRVDQQARPLEHVAGVTFD